MYRAPRASRSRLLPFALCLLASLLVVGDALAQSWAGKGRLRGSVKTEDGKPIEGAEILLYKDSEGNGPEPLYTNRKGRWEYLGLTGGDFTIRVTAEGYIPSEGLVTVNEYGSNRTPPIDMNLRSLKDIQDKEASRVGGLLDQANAKMRAGDWSGARAGYEEVKAAMNDPAQVRQVDLAIAETHLQEGNTQEARTRFQALADGEEDPVRKAALLQRVARSQYDEGNVDASLETLESALVLVPEDVATLRMAIDILVSEGREADAEPYMNRLPAGEKVDANALLNVGIAAYNEGNIETALEKFERVLGDYPDNPNAHYYVGLCYLSQGTNDKARAHLEKLLELAPDHEKATEAKEFLTYL
ncbi:MAG: tetratricopeptide repeat protein [Thermoanaerobaculia bacterium]|nr:tetratricopeptide repeat protein [Thermoanaerobaculia bacterium]